MIICIHTLYFLTGDFINKIKENKKNIAPMTVSYLYSYILEIKSFFEVFFVNTIFL